jgi:hypothetical protein
VAPEGLGGVKASTCTIAILSPGAARTLARDFGELKVEMMDGRPVWTWSIPPSEGYKTADRFYAAIVADSFFVLATGAEEFREVANALDRGTVAAALASGPDLPSLRAHSYWAYRSIRREGTGDKWASGVTALPVSAVALELFTEFDDGKLYFNIRIPDDPSGGTPADLPSSESIRFQRAGPGTWQAVISISSNSHQTTDAVFRAIFYFGYGVFL